MRVNTGYIRRTILLSSTAMLLGLAHPAYAACTPGAPTDGQTTNCTGSTTTGLSVSADNVTVNVASGATLSLGGGTALQYTGGAGTAKAQINGTLSGTTAIAFGNKTSTLELGSGYNITGNVNASAGAGDKLVLTGTSNGTFNASQIGTKYNGFETFEKTGTSTWELTGTGTQNWTVTGGTLMVASSAPLGTTTLNGGSLLLNETTASTQVNYQSGINVGAGGGTVTAQGGGSNTYTLSGTLAGTGDLTTAGWNKIVFAGDASTYTGTVIVSSSQFQGTGTALKFNIENNATVIMTSDTAANYGYIMSGAGNLVKYGANALTLSGVNTYTGGTQIAQDLLIASQDANLGGSAGNLSIDNAATFQYAGSFDMTRSVVMNGATSAIDTNGYNSTLNGVVSGTGALNKKGTGTLTLAGNNTYAGNTIVTGGTLAVASNTALGTGSLTLNTGTALQAAAAAALNNAIALGAGSESIDTNGFNLTLNGVVSGTGALTKTGTGNLTLAGTNTYNGATAISAGKLVVNGSNTASTTTIGASGTLGGTGTTGTIINNGTLAPGNSIGTLNVTGALTFNNGSTYSVEVNNAAGSDKTIATGAITINGGTVSVLAVPGTYANTNTYTILQGSSVTGTFTSATTDLAFFTPTLTYNANNVQLNLNRNLANFADVTTDQSQKSVAKAVEQLGNGNALYDSFVGLSNTAAVQALDTLSGEHNSGLASATMQSSTDVRNIVMTRVQDRSLSSDSGNRNRAALHSSNTSYALNDAALSVIEPAAGGTAARASTTLWSEAFGRRGHSDSQGAAPGQNRESGGILFGMDSDITEDIVLGAFGGWEQGEIYTNSQMANSDIDTWHGGLYTAHQISDVWRISAGISGSYHDIDTTRHISVGTFNQTAHGDTSGYTVSAYAETGYTFDVDTVALEPFIGLDFTHNAIDGYTETGATAANLVVGETEQNTPGHVMGLRAAKAFDIDDTRTFNLRGQLGWQHLYGNLDSNSNMRFSAGNTPFSAEGSGLARDSAIIGLGFDADLTSRGKIYLNYDGSLSTDDQNHGLTLGVKVKF